MKTTYNQQIVNRLKRSEGQMRGVINMITEEKDCKQVVTQLSAIRSSIDRAIGLIVAENLAQCIQENVENGIPNDDALKQAIDLLIKSR